MTRRTFPAMATLVCVMLFATAFAQTSTSVAYNYANISYPGAISTSANGINNSNVIVGSYFDTQDFVHGFVYRTGKFTAVNFPGATATEVLGINDSGDIAGVYQVSGPLNFHGFLRRNGGFTTIDFPGASFGTTTFGINKSGTIVGSYDNSQGFVYEDGNYRKLIAPQLPGESIDTQLNSINNLGWIAGQVFTGGNWRGFWVSGNDFDFLEPRGSTDSQVTGINGRGDIVGCHDVLAGFVSFAVESSEGNEGTENFPAQQSLVSCASAINYARVVVGNYFTVNRPNGFLAVPALTLNVTSPKNHSFHTNPVHLAAKASGNNPIRQMQVWVNFKEVFHVKGGDLNAYLTLPVGTHEQVVIQAVDSKGVAAKVAETITTY